MILSKVFPKMKLNQATAIAERVKAELAPHCERIEVAGSIRRRKADAGDIEIVCIPKTYDCGLFQGADTIVDPQFCALVDRWPAVKGQPTGKYTQRILPDGINLDIFIARPQNWGLIYAIRTGSADFSHRVLATGWARNGFKSVAGMLFSRSGVRIDVREESDLFRFAGVPWVDPEERT